MKTHLLYALPVLLAACGPTVTKAGGEGMPAPEPLKADKPAKSASTTAVQETELAGTWSQDGEDTAIYADADGAELVKIRCLPADEDQGTGPVLALQRPVGKASDATTVGVFTDAGAFSMPASVDTDSGMITGTLGADSPRLTALMVGQGGLKLRAGNDVYVLENSKAVEAVVMECRPPPVEAAPLDENADGAPENSEADSATPDPSSQM